jgi:hypothetical protein
MALGPASFDVMAGGGLFQFHPQILIHYRLLGGGFPAGCGRKRIVPAEAEGGLAEHSSIRHLPSV